MALGSRTAPWASPLTFFLPSSPRLQLSHCSLTPAAGNPVPPRHLIGANAAGHRAPPPWRPPPWRSLPAGSSFPWPTPQPWRLSSSRSASALPPPSSSVHGTAGHWRPCFPCDFHGREFPLVAISPARPLQASSDFVTPRDPQTPQNATKLHI
jgi:hypothetical protein